MSILEKIVPLEYDGVKIREYLKEELELSSRLIRRASVEKRIFVNDEAVKMNFKLKSYDKVKIDLNREEPSPSTNGTIKARWRQRAVSDHP